MEEFQLMKGNEAVAEAAIRLSGEARVLEQFNPHNAPITRLQKEEDMVITI